MRTNSQNSFPWKFSIAEVPRELQRQNVFICLLVTARSAKGGRGWVERTFRVVSCTFSRMRIVVPPNSDVVSVDILRTGRKWLRDETQLWL